MATTTATQVWYLRNGDLEQIVACDQALAMQLLGAMSGSIKQVPEEMDPYGDLRAIACQHPGTIFTKHSDEPRSAWQPRVT